ncbi:MAG: DNA-formamidopyrimidine glycosylase family protein [Planctomycetota bacterium]
MSEGPQVKLTTERLQRQSERRVISRCTTTRPPLSDFAASIVGATCERVFCKGKQIFFDFGSDRFLNNHLLMRGRWRVTTDRFMLLPPEIWIAFESGRNTVYNYMGQVLRVLDAAQMRALMNSLGPDVMSEDCTEQDIACAISQQPKPLGELLLDQAVISGVGNVAKSESLFLAGLHPEMTPADLPDESLVRLGRAIIQVMGHSYSCGGRWRHRVYRMAGKHCFDCGTRIIMIRQGRQKRSTYFCSRCQPKG